MLYKEVICIFCIFECLLQIYSKTTSPVKKDSFTSKIPTVKTQNSKIVGEVGMVG